MAISSRTALRPAVFASLATLAAIGAAAAHGQAVAGGPLPGPLPLLPPDNWWNADVSSAPVDSNSAGFISWIGVNRGLHPDLGGDSSPFPEIYGMVYVVVPGTQPLEVFPFDYAGESDAGAPGRPPGYPVPVEAKTQPHWIEGGYPGNAGKPGDKHMLLVDRDHRVLFELFNLRCTPTTSPSCSWRAGSGAVFPLDSNLRRPDTWTSADAAGLAILPGLIRYDEVYGPDPIRHAFRFTTRDTNGYVFPASHSAGSNPSAPPMGTRLRLKASKDISGFPAPARKIFQAMKTYGMIVADNGTDMYVSGTYDTRWDNGILNPAFASLRAGDFEVIRLGWRPATVGGSVPSHLTTITPCRAVDTRGAAGPLGGPGLDAGAVRSFTLMGACGIPPGTVAVSANVTVADASSPGSLRMFPGTGSAPDINTVSFAAGSNRANNLLLGLEGGAFSVQNDQLSGTVNLILDVNGFFQ